MARVQSPSSQEIQDLFENLAPRYDLFNDFTSLGLARSWRKKALSGLCPGMKVLDLGCGSGDLAIAAARRVYPGGEVLGLDFSKTMLEVARRRAALLPGSLRDRLHFLNENAQNLPLEEKNFDVIVSGFVLRNLYANIDQILQGILLSLKKGGQIRLLDMTLPKSRPGVFLFKFYMNHVAAFYGRLLFGKNFPTHYIAESAERFFKAEEFVGRLRTAGFAGVRSQNLFLGMVTLYEGHKP